MARKIQGKTLSYKPKLVVAGNSVLHKLKPAPARDPISDKSNFFVARFSELPHAILIRLRYPPPLAPFPHTPLTWDFVLDACWQILYRFAVEVAYLAWKASAPLPPLNSEHHPDMVIRTDPRPNCARVVCVSDTHSLHDKLPPLPPGDILIHAGDLSMHGTKTELEDAFRWLSAAPHAHKIVVVGNHDVCMHYPAIVSDLRAQFPQLTLLNESSVKLPVRGRLLSVWGSPRTPRAGVEGTTMGVFQYTRKLVEWRIPRSTDILVTHGPPAFHLDGSSEIGCRALLSEVRRRRPLLHVFGHIHSGRGLLCARFGTNDMHVLFRNVLGGRTPWAASLARLCLTAVRAKVKGSAEFTPYKDTVLVNACSLKSMKPSERTPSLAPPIVVDIPLRRRFGAIMKQ